MDIPKLPIVDIIKHGSKTDRALVTTILVLCVLTILAFFFTSSEPFKIIASVLLFSFIICIYLLYLNTSKKATAPNHDTLNDKQAAAIPYKINNGEILFLIIKSSTGRWIYPKGDIKFPREIWKDAEREAFNEAGVLGTIDTAPVGTFTHLKTDLKTTGKVKHITAFLLLVKSEQAPIENHRDPRWVTPEEAAELFFEKRTFDYGQEYKNITLKAVDKLRISVLGSTS